MPPPNLLFAYVSDDLPADEGLHGASVCKIRIPLTLRSLETGILAVGQRVIGVWHSASRPIVPERTFFPVDIGGSCYVRVLSRIRDGKMLTDYDRRVVRRRSGATGRCIG